MNRLTQEILARAETLPESIQQEALEFAPPVSHFSVTALLSESALATDWNRPEEDEVWAIFQ